MAEVLVAAGIAIMRDEMDAALLYDWSHPKGGLWHHFKVSTTSTCGPGKAMTGMTNNVPICVSIPTPATTTPTTTTTPSTSILNALYWRAMGEYLSVDLAAHPNAP